MVDATAVLGIAVDSADAERQLRNFEAIARRTGETADQVRDRYTKFAGQLKYGLPQLQASAKAAGDQADAMSKLSTSTSRATAALATFSRAALPLAALIGTAVALKEAISKLSDLGDRMQDTRLSEGMLQGLKVGAAEARVSQDDLNRAINTFTEVSKKAAPEAKEFYKALSNISPAMAQAFKDQAGNAGGQDQRMYILADAIKSAKNETERFQLAQKALGTDNERLISIFLRGAAALNDYKDAASKYGMVVDTALIQKAQEAQKALSIFSTVVSSRVSVAMADLIPVLTKILPYLERLITGLASFLANYTVLGSKGTEVLSGEIAGLNKQIDDLEAKNAKIKSGELSSPIPKWAGGGALDDSAIKLNQGQIDQLKAQVAEKQKLIEAIPIGPNKPSNDNAPVGFAGRPSLKDDPATPFDRAVTSINKHIAALKADAEAVGQSVGEHARLRTEAQLLEAAQQKGAKATDDQKEKIKALGQAAADAATALERARVASEIKFDKQTAFLSSDDVQIAQRLRGLYGDDVPAALASSEAAAMRVNIAMKGLGSALENDLGSGLTDIATGAKSLKDGFSDMTTALIKDITRLIIQMTILRPLMSSIGGIFGGGINLSGFGFNPIAGVTGHAIGGHVRGPGSGTSDSILTRVSNGEFIVNAAATARNLPLLHAINDNIPADGFAAGGLRGNIAQGAFGGGPFNVIINNAPSQPTISQKQNANGGRDLMIDFATAVKGVLVDDANKNGPISKAFAARQAGFGGR